ncbi:MAG TPA: class II aldolase/adducin family protein, partial [Longimicrobiales bacterium]|nr:class II aldolase/adducin family protein [Longimicrobiales bacterium]
MMISVETREYPELTAALDSLLHYSRQLGADESLVLGGGGNTSIKARGSDVAGRPLDVLLVKGSGSELKSAQAHDFTPMRLADLLMLRTRDRLSDEDMVDYLARCKLDPSAPRPSIETLLHAFIPAASVFHSHADAILMLTNSRENERVLRELFGDTVITIPYERPGFGLSRAVADAVAATPEA